MLNMFLNLSHVKYSMFTYIYKICWRLVLSYMCLMYYY